MRVHRFDGTGYFQLRCTRKGSFTAGITVDYFMQGSFAECMRCVVSNVDDRKKKPHIRINAVLWIWIYHRPLLAAAQI